MKKSLIAFAVLAASGAAMAQSSVTMYGVADLSLSKSSGTSAQMSGNGLINNGSSRLGVRGVEDLGGGLKASFNFEQGINAETGKTDANTYQRAAWVALSGGFGKFQMGRALSPSFWGALVWDVMGTANYSPTVVQFNYSGGTARNNSQFMYSTPALGGFGADIAYVAKPDNGGNAKVEFDLKYVNGPLGAAFAYNKTQNSERGMGLGVTYDFGMFKLAASLQNPAGPSKGFSVGGSVPVGPVSVALDIARENGSGMKNTDFALETKYALSKRTFAYAVYYKDGDAGGGIYKTGAKNSFGVGVRHNF